MGYLRLTSFLLALFLTLGLLGKPREACAQTDTFTPTSTETGTPTLSYTVTDTFTPTVTPTPTVTNTPTQPPVSLSAGANMPPNSVQIPGNSNVPVLQVSVTNTSGEGVTLNFIVFNSPATETGNDSGISAVKLWRDVSGNGVVDGSSILLASSTYASNAVTLGGFPLATLPAGAPQTYLVTYDFSPTASLGSYTTGITANVSVQGGGQTSGKSILVSGAPLSGATLTLAAPTATFSPTSTRTWTASFTPSRSATPSFTATVTPTRTPTVTSSFTHTFTSSFTATFTRTFTITATPTATPTQPAVSIALGAQPPPNSIQIPGNSNVPVLQMSAANNSGEGVTLGYIVFNSPATETGNDSGISAVKLWRDVNGNGVVDGSSILLASAIYSSHAVTLGGFPLATLPGGTTQTYLLTYDFSSSAPLGSYTAAIAANTNLQGGGQTTGKPILVSGAPLNGATIAVAAPTATPSPTGTFTPTPTLTFTATFTPTPTFTSSFSPTFTPTSTSTFTATFTSTFTGTPTPTETATPTVTPLPPTKLVFLPQGPLASGMDSGPLTVEARNSAGGPATILTAITVSLTSDSAGENSFSQSPGGSRVTSIAILPGNPDGVFYYRDYKAGAAVLTASASSLAPGSASVSVAPGPFAQLQVILPGQSSDPGRPVGNPLGKTGTPVSVAAGQPVAALVNAVDGFFNVVPSVSDSVTFTTTDTGAPAEGTVSLASGTAVHSVTFFTPGNQSVTATDLSDPSKNAGSSPVAAIAGSQSTLLDVVHSVPNLTTVARGQAGVTVLTFLLKVQSGTDPVDLTTLQLHAKDSTGGDVALNSAFGSLVLRSGSRSYAQDVSGTASAFVTLGTFPLGTFTMNASSALPVALVADISPSASAKVVRLAVEGNTSLTAQDDTASGTPPTAVTSAGDATGFPMASNLMLLLEGDVQATYGNYPNPFRAGLEKTTLEFYLPSASMVALTLYDATGRHVATPLTRQSLGAGLQRVAWDGRNEAGTLVVNGVYYAQLDVNGTTFLRKVAVVK